MNFEIFTLGVVLFPGVIVTSILQFFNIKSESYNNIKFCLYSFIYGLIIELFYFSFSLKENLKFEIGVGKDAKVKLRDFIISINWKDIFWLLIISIIIGVILSFLRNSGYVHGRASRYRITYETGFKTLLYSIYHSQEEYFVNVAKCYVYIKLLNGKAGYYGVLMAYEDQKDYIEILLKNVDIYFENNLPSISQNEEEREAPPKKNYKKPYLYLQLRPCEFQIEYVEKNDKISKEREKIRSFINKKFYLCEGIYRLIIIFLLVVSLVAIVRVLFE